MGIGSLQMILKMEEMTVHRAWTDPPSQLQKELALPHPDRGLLAPVREYLSVAEAPEN